MRGFTTLSRKRPHYFVQPWVAVSSAEAVASGPFFGMEFLDFMQACFLSGRGHFRHFGFNSLTLPIVRR
jgi:hypothetical protein